MHLMLSVNNITFIAENQILLQLPNTFHTFILIQNGQDIWALFLNLYSIQDSHLCHIVPRGAQVQLGRVPNRVKRFAAIHKCALTCTLWKKENIIQHDVSMVEDVYAILGQS